MKKSKDQLQCFMASGESVKDLLECKAFIAPKLAQWIRCCTSVYTTVCSEGRHITGPMIIETAKSYYD